MQLLAYFFVCSQLFAAMNQSYLITDFHTFEAETEKLLNDIKEKMRSEVLYSSRYNQFDPIKHVIETLSNYLITLRAFETSGSYNSKVANSIGFKDLPVLTKFIKHLSDKLNKELDLDINAIEAWGHFVVKELRSRQITGYDVDLKRSNYFSSVIPWAVLGATALITFGPIRLGHFEGWVDALKATMAVLAVTMVGINIDGFIGSESLDEHSEYRDFQMALNGFQEKLKQLKGMPFTDEGDDSAIYIKMDSPDDSGEGVISMKPPVEEKEVSTTVGARKDICPSGIYSLTN